MRDRYGILIGTGLDKIRTTTLRVGHMGITSSPMYVLPTLSAIEMTLRDLGYRSEAGAGVSAAPAGFSSPPPRSSSPTPSPPPSTAARGARAPRASRRSTRF